MKNILLAVLAILAILLVACTDDAKDTWEDYRDWRDANNEWLEEYGLYIKDGEDIVSFLALIGASKAVIKFEEIRVLKDARNNINRIVNYALHQ